MHLPRGRFTDALIAVAAFVALFVIFAIGSRQALGQFGFVPVDFLGGGWRAYPLLSFASPLSSAFIPPNLLDVVFNGVFLLIAGRFVERAIGGAGLGAVFLVGIYAGAAARLLLTPGSGMVSAGLSTGLFAVIGAYLMLYGVPQALPVPRHLPRSLQIAILAGYWLVVQLVFSMVGGGLEISASIVGPIGGLIAGMLLARPLLAWHYRRA